MIRSIRTIAVVALSTLAFAACGGGTKPAEAPETMPTAEPPPTPGADAATSMAAPSTATAAQAKDEMPAASKVEPLTDEQIAAITDAANTTEIDQANLAESKSKDPAVKKFAAMMIMHHGAAKTKQAKLKLKTAESSTSTAMAADAASTMDSLKVDKGKDFDKAYIAAQIDGHQKVLDAINDKLLPNVKRSDLKAYIEGIKPTVEAHLKEAKQLQESFDSKSSSVQMGPKHAG
ncbi:MAG: DUF4142 domain-containing protein [Polyangiaceae bacterium]